MLVMDWKIIVFVVEWKMCGGVCFGFVVEWKINGEACFVPWRSPCDMVEWNAYGGAYFVLCWSRWSGMLAM